MEHLSWKITPAMLLWETGWELSQGFISKGERVSCSFFFCLFSPLWRVSRGISRNNCWYNWLPRTFLCYLCANISGILTPPTHTPNTHMRSMNLFCVWLASSDPFWEFLTLKSQHWFTRCVVSFLSYAEVRKEPRSGRFLHSQHWRFIKRSFNAS